MFWGFYDSFQGIFTVFYVDKELNKRELSRLSPTHSHSPVRRKNLYIREQIPIPKLQKHEYK